MWTRFTCIILAAMLMGPIAKAGSSLSPDYRPKEDLREQVYSRIALLQAATTEESRCEAANEFDQLFYLFYWKNGAAIEDDLIAKMSALLDQDTLHGTRKCVSHVIGGMFMTMGPRAMAAMPSLERALAAAELERSTSMNPSECSGFDFNPDRKLDYELRQALVNIDGREREKGYVLKCPKDGDPPG